ncbi:MAG: glycosyltransferase family 2 protein [Pseudomonadota bacterium]
MDLSIVIPVFNEVESIGPLLDEISTRFDAETGYEIIVVDDGSVDDTPAVLQTARQSLPQLRTLHHHECYGQSAAIASGVRAASKHWIATLDGDGQNDPADILKLFRIMDETHDDVQMVAGYRKQRRDGWLKRVTSRVANAVRATVLNDSTPDSACGLRIFARTTFLSLPQFDHMHRFLPALVQRQGGKVLSVEVNHRERLRGQSKYGIHNRLWIGIIDLMGVLWLQRRGKQPVVSEIT